MSRLFANGVRKSQNSYKILQFQNKNKKNKKTKIKMKPIIHVNKILLQENKTKT